MRKTTTDYDGMYELSLIHERTYVCVELAHEAGEVAVLEEAGEEQPREAGGVDDDEAVVVPAPPDERVRPRVAHHLVGLGHERRCLEELVASASASDAAPGEQPQRELRVEAVHHQPEDTLETDRSIDDGVGNTYDRAIRASLACSAADRAPVPRAQHARTHARSRQAPVRGGVAPSWMDGRVNFSQKGAGGGGGCWRRGAGSARGVTNYGHRRRA